MFESNFGHDIKFDFLAKFSDTDCCNQLDVIQSVNGISNTTYTRYITAGKSNLIKEPTL